MTYLGFLLRVTTRLQSRYFLGLRPHQKFYWGKIDPLSHCKEKDVDDCWFYFTYSVNGNNEATVHVVETPGRNLIISKFFAFSFMSLYCLGLLVVSLISRNNSSWTIICPSWDTFNLSKLKLVFN